MGDLFFFFYVVVERIVHNYYAAHRDVVSQISSPICARNMVKTSHIFISDRKYLKKSHFFNILCFL